jgi:nucleoside phosphorylase
MPDEQRVRVAGRDFWVGHLQGQPLVAVLSRIGKVAAATTATVLLERFGVRAIVFTGVVRTISDRADDGAHADFLRFVAAVASRYSLALIQCWLAGLPRPSAT